MTTLALRLLGKGMALGTTPAFRTAITAASFPELLILKRVIKTPPIATFATIVAIGIP